MCPQSVVFEGWIRGGGGGGSDPSFFGPQNPGLDLGPSLDLQALVNQEMKKPETKRNETTF